MFMYLICKRALTCYQVYLVYSTDWDGHQKIQANPTLLEFFVDLLTVACKIHVIALRSVGDKGKCFPYYTIKLILRLIRIFPFPAAAWVWPDALDMDSSDSESWTSNTVRKLTASFEASLTAERDPKILPRPQRSPARRSWDVTEMRNEVYHRKIISWFGDSPLAAFGLHQLIEYGKKSGKIAGDWYGPAVVAHILR